MPFLQAAELVDGVAVFGAWRDAGCGQCCVQFEAVPVAWADGVAEAFGGIGRCQQVVRVRAWTGRGLPVVAGVGVDVCVRRGVLKGGGAHGDLLTNGVRLCHWGVARTSWWLRPELDVMPLASSAAHRLVRRVAQAAGPRRCR